MPDRTPLANVVTLVTDKVTTHKDRRLPYVGLEHLATDSPDLVGWAHADSSVSTNSVFRKGDVLFGKLRPNLRKSVIAPFAGYCSTDILVLRALPGTDPRFAALLCRSEAVRTAAVRSAIGTRMPRTSWADLRDVPVLFVPPGEQQWIGSIVEAADQAIRAGRELISKLRAVKLGLMRELLRHGIGESGEVRDPHSHPEQFKDSPIGRIPRRWRVSSLGAVSSHVTSGSRGWGAYYAERGALFVRIGNLTRDHINLRLDKLVHVIPPEAESRRTRLEHGDVLISVTADLGIVGVVPRNLGEAYVNQHIALVRVAASKANSRWVAHYLAGPQAQALMRRLDDPGAKAGLNLPTVRGFYVPLPPRSEQDDIADRLDAADRAIATEEECVRKLLLVRAGLLDDLAKGKVAVARLSGDAAS